MQIEQIGRGARRAVAVAAAGGLALACVGGGEDADGAGGAAEEAAAASADTALRRLARELVPDLEQRSGLEARYPPRLARRSRGQLEAFLERELAEQLPREKARALGATYARLGLVPDTLRLRETLRRLYMEQVVGYYDPAADTLFVLEDVPPEEARMVLVHELVHALQDQHLDLDSLTSALRGQNDRSAAARAAIEGHATFVMAEWALARTSGADADLTGMPGIAEKLAKVAAQGAPESMPAFTAAPRVIRETLTFPYVGGFRYVQQMWNRAEGRPAPFGSRLPVSTEQVIHPARGPGAGADAPTDVTFRSGGPAGWREVHATTLGELETRVFLTVHLGADSVASAAAAGWDGDRARLLASERGEEALVWVSVWDSTEEARAFADAVRRAYRARYGDAAGREVAVDRSRLSGRPAVTLVDRPESVEAGALAPAVGVRLSEAPARGGSTAGGGGP